MGVIYRGSPRLHDGTKLQHFNMLTLARADSWNRTMTRERPAADERHTRARPGTDHARHSTTKWRPVPTKGRVPAYRILDLQDIE